MANIEIRPAQRADCDDLAPRLRDADRAETWASLGLTPLGTLVLSLKASDLAWAVVIDGRVEGLFGVGADEKQPDAGVPWLLGSDALSREPRAMLRLGRRYIALMATLYTHLHNAVHHEHVESFKWLEHLGFARVATLDDFGVHPDTFYLYVYV